MDGVVQQGGVLDKKRQVVIFPLSGSIGLSDRRAVVFPPFFIRLHIGENEVVRELVFHCKSGRLIRKIHTEDPHHLSLIHI